LNLFGFGRNRFKGEGGGQENNKKDDFSGRTKAIGVEFKVKRVRYTKKYFC
jgi:hypothetical protein